MLKTSVRSRTDPLRYRYRSRGENRYEPTECQLCHPPTLCPFKHWEANMYRFAMIAAALHYYLHTIIHRFFTASSHCVLRFLDGDSKLYPAVPSSKSPTDNSLRLQP